MLIISLSNKQPCEFYHKGVDICGWDRFFLKGKGLWYYETVKKSGWGGAVEIDGEEHVFHLFNLELEKVGALIQKFVPFI